MDLKTLKCRINRSNQWLLDKTLTKTLNDEEYFFSFTVSVKQLMWNGFEVMPKCLRLILS